MSRTPPAPSTVTEPAVHRRTSRRSPTPDSPGAASSVSRPSSTTGPARRTGAMAARSGGRSASREARMARAHEAAKNTTATATRQTRGRFRRNASAALPQAISRRASTRAIGTGPASAPSEAPTRMATAGTAAGTDTRQSEQGWCRQHGRERCGKERRAGSEDDRRRSATATPPIPAVRSGVPLAGSQILRAGQTVQWQELRHAGDG